MTILRTQRDGCWQVQSNSWGQFLAPAVDPDADTVITKEQLEGFELHPDTPKIPTELWSKWVNLCIELCRRGTGDLEVSCRLLRHVDDPTKYRICVPVQKVTSVSVRVESFDKAVDIETGELIEQWPPEGWRPCGSSHSHNTMDAFFSGTDDKYELGDPGLHIVVGKINTQTGDHELCASVTANMRRFLIDPEDVLTMECSTDEVYSPKCLDAITFTPAAPKLGRYKTVTTTHHWADDNYSSNTFLAPISALDAEKNAVMAAVDQLILRAKTLDESPEKALSDLAYEIDELAFNNQADPLNDPFYWSADVL